MVYWAALLAVLAWRPLVEYWRITTSPTGHGTMQFSYGGDLLPVALWIAGPPLALFLFWLATRSPVERESVNQ